MSTSLSRINRLSRLALAAIAIGTFTGAFAGQEMMELDSHFRAKIAKEKIRIGAQERKQDEQARREGRSTSDTSQSSCGSQSIGNIDTGGRATGSPREVFVFAPNAINIVGQGGCR